LSCPKSYFQSQDKVAVAELTSKLKEKKTGLMKQIGILINAFADSKLKFNKNI
jgi:hypothetical protein